MSSSPSRTSPGLVRLALVISLALLGPLLAGCSSAASTRAADAANGPGTTAPPATAPASIPAGTVLRVGDQLDYLKTVLKLANQDQNFPYQVEYSAFVGGPAMLQAFQGGAIDTGFVGSTPLIFAQAGGQTIPAVAGWASDNGSYGLITSDPSINGWKDIKGKRVAIQKGTAAEAVLLESLDAEGLKPTDVTVVDLPVTQASTALQSGSADAAISIEPLTSVYFAANPNGREVAKARAITDRSSFAIASQAALDDPAKAAALGDYLTRVVRSFNYVNDHKELIADAVYVKQYKLTPERAAAIVAQSGNTKFVSLPGDVVPAQQHLADLFQAAGSIPTKVDVSKEFDTRYNDLILQAAGR